jgi:hypothetical protein
VNAATASTMENYEENDKTVMRLGGRSYQTDDNAEPPPSLLAKHPYAIDKEELDA